MSEQPLPLAGYDELPVNTLQHRIRELDSAQLQQLLDHERAHANRVAVIEVLRRRHEELQRGAAPSPGAEKEPDDVPSQTQSGSVVQPAGPRGTGRPTEHGANSATGKGKEHQ